MLKQRPNLAKIAGIFMLAALALSSGVVVAQQCHSLPLTSTAQAETGTPLLTKDSHPGHNHGSSQPGLVAAVSHHAALFMVDVITSDNLVKEICIGFFVLILFLGHHRYRSKKRVGYQALSRAQNLLTFASSQVRVFALSRPQLGVLRV